MKKNFFDFLQVFARYMKLNTTKHYHLYDLETLGWELTVCNSLSPAQSPCRSILKENASYGDFLYEFMNRLCNLDKGRHILEIGGGYGYLMKDFLDRNPSLKVTMLDISPYLLSRQQETLRGSDITFRREDFLETHMESLGYVDIAILNENLGDFPTVVDICHDTLFSRTPGSGNDLLAEVTWYIACYGLDIPRQEFYHFNLGAIQAVEKLCAAHIPVIFISEHSCEAHPPKIFPSLSTFGGTPGIPERIALKGHDEYTIQFSHLEKIAAPYGYHIIRGPLADIIPIDITDRLHCCLAAPAARTDQDEVIRHFVEDLYKYEYLLLTR